jgi:hypothetical protein
MKICIFLAEYGILKDAKQIKGHPILTMGYYYKEQVVSRRPICAFLKYRCLVMISIEEVSIDPSRSMVLSLIIV